MYFPILRGRQFELLALRECVNQEYDGIEYNSTTNPGGYNLAIFNPDLFECVSVSVYDIEKLQYTSKRVL